MSTPAKLLVTLAVDLGDSIVKFETLESWELIMDYSY